MIKAEWTNADALDLQPTCNQLATDCISRQAVKEWLDRWEGYIDKDVITRMKYRTIDIPSAQPEVDCQKCVFCGFAGFKQFQTAQSDVSDTNVGDMISRRAAIDARRYTFGNDEFSLEAAYHDCKMVFDGITDDDSFQEADTGLILYYANEIIYALQEALVKDTNVPTNDCISRQAAIDEITEYGSGNTIYMSVAELKRRIEHLPSAQPEIMTCRDCKHYEADIMGNPWGVCCHKDWVIGNCGSLVDEKGWCYRAERRTDE